MLLSFIYRHVGISRMKLSLLRAGLESEEMTFLCTGA